MTSMPEELYIRSVPTRGFVCSTMSGRAPAFGAKYIRADVADAEIARLREQRNRLIEILDDLMGSFEGVTDNADDPDRLHTWERLEAYGWDIKDALAVR